MRFDIETFIKKWKLYTGTKLVLFQGDFMSAKHARVLADTSRTTVYNALVNLETEFEIDRKLVFAANPSSIYSGAAYDRTELKLAPLTLLQSIVADGRGKGPVKVACKGTDGVFLSAPNRAKASHVENDAERFLFVPFWWVDITSDETQANMKHVSKKVGDVTIVYLTNLRKLTKHERLYVFKQKSIREDLEGGSQVPPTGESNAANNESSESDSEPPAKRPKGKAKAKVESARAPKTKAKAAVTKAKAKAK